MKKAIMVGLACIVVFSMVGSGCALNPWDAKGSGKLVQNPYQFTDFTRLTFSNLFKAKISQADSFSVMVTVDDNIEKYLDVTQHGNELRFTLENGHGYRNITLNVNITLPGLERLRVERDVGVPCVNQSLQIGAGMASPGFLRTRRRISNRFEGLFIAHF